jgi:hypothetical protein
VGGNGLYCAFWRQHGWQASQRPLALSPQTVTLTCAPPTPTQPSRCVSINASGGDISNGRYTWETTKGEISITGVNQQNIQLKPPTNDGSKINGPAYAIQANNTTDGFSCNLFHFVKEVYGCNDQVVISCTFFDASVCDNTGIISFARGANNNMCPFPAFADECTGLRTIRQFQCDIREQNGIPKTCNPCGISMQGGATITVSGSSGPPVEMTVTVR